MTHRLDIPLARLEDAFPAEFREADKLCKPGVRYRQRYSISNGCLAVTFEEIPEIPAKQPPSLVPSKW